MNRREALITAVGLTVPTFASAQTVVTARPTYDYLYQIPQEFLTSNPLLHPHWTDRGLEWKTGFGYGVMATWKTVNGSGNCYQKIGVGRGPYYPFRTLADGLYILRSRLYSLRVHESRVRYLINYNPGEIVHREIDPQTQRLGSQLLTLGAVKFTPRGSLSCTGRNGRPIEYPHLRTLSGKNFWELTEQERW